MHTIPKLIVISYMLSFHKHLVMLKQRVLQMFSELNC